ncbi:MAG: glycosyltransferase family 39 protein, partial [Polaromonas sp.]|nr:glycosyltransferase family 39 protein [Polaromonas sp.]
MLERSAAPAAPLLSPFLVRWLVAVGALSLALRLWISATFPITGDEAFFYWWGVYPDWGYYDHPPMVGWLIALVRATLGDTTWAIRLPVVLLPLALGGLVAWALAPLDRVRAAWAVLFFWLAPINWLNVLITTDTPLIFWSVLSVALLLRAERRERMDRTAWGLYALSGLALGCAFLSKYFSVVLGLTYLVYFALYRRERWAAFALLVLCALPGPAINIAYNMSHGWSNIMFNLYNRNEGESFAWNKPLLYLAMLVYLVTPVAAWLTWKQRGALAAAARQQRLLACVVVVPLLFFALLSLKKVVGLHWVLSFYPFGFALLAFALPRDKLKTCAVGMAAFAALHVLVVAGLHASSLDNWKNTKLYPQIIRSYK